MAMRVNDGGAVPNQRAATCRAGGLLWASPPFPTGVRTLDHGAAAHLASGARDLECFPCRGAPVARWPCRWVGRGAERGTEPGWTVTCRAQTPRPTEVGSAWRLARGDDPAGVAGRHGDRASRNPIRGPRSPDRTPPCRPGPARARGRRGATDVDRRGGRRHQQPHQGHEPGEAEGRASVGRRHEDRPPPAGVPVGLVDPGELVDQHGRLDFDRCVLKEGLEGPDRPAPERSCPDAPIGRSATGLRDHRHVGEAADRGVCSADPSLASRAWTGGSRACGVSPRARDDGTRLTAPSSWCRQDAPVARLEQRATHDLR
jgi:hypothetical protein